MAVDKTWHHCTASALFTLGDHSWKDKTIPSAAVAAALGSVCGVDAVSGVDGVVEGVDCCPRQKLASAAVHSGSSGSRLLQYKKPVFLPATATNQISKTGLPEKSDCVGLESDGFR